MTSMNFLVKFKNQSANAEQQTGVATSSVKNTQQPQNVQMVSNKAIDTDMTDKVVKTTPVPTPQAAVKNTPPEEESLLTSALNCFADCTNAVIDTVSECAGTVTDVVVEAYHDTMVYVQETTDFEWVHDHVATLDLNNENKAKAAKNSAKSKHKRCNERTGHYLVCINDEHMQFGAASVCIKEGNEIARRSIAECTHCMHKENQATITGMVVEQAQEVETANIAIDNIQKCDKEVQADAVAQSAKGTVYNKNFTREEKGQVGRNIAIVIPKLDEAAQAQSFTSLAETMHDYEEVVTEVSHQVATNVSEAVKNDTIKNLSNSKYENLQETFTKENIERIATEYKRALGIEEKVSEKTIEQIAKETKTNNLFDIKKATQNILAKEATKPQAKAQVNTSVETKVATNPFAQTEKVAPVTEILNKIQPEAEDAKETQELKQILKNCKSVTELSSVLQSCPAKVAKKMFKTISKTDAEALFKHSQNSTFMQVFLLKNGFVKYADVKNHCNPVVNNVLNIFTNIEEYQVMIDEYGENSVDEQKFEKEIAQAILKI